jgi:hypothetical protein
MNKEKCLTSMFAIMMLCTGCNEKSNNSESSVIDFITSIETESTTLYNNEIEEDNTTKVEIETEVETDVSSEVNLQENSIDEITIDKDETLNSEVLIRDVTEVVNITDENGNTITSIDENGSTIPVTSYINIIDEDGNNITESYINELDSNSVSTDSYDIVRVSREIKKNLSGNIVDEIDNSYTGSKLIVTEKDNIKMYNYYFNTKLDSSIWFKDIFDAPKKCYVNEIDNADCDEIDIYFMNEDDEPIACYIMYKLEDIVDSSNSYYFYNKVDNGVTWYDEDYQECFEDAYGSVKDLYFNKLNIDFINNKISRGYTSDKIIISIVGN